jgi:hypothetical protein
MVNILNYLFPGALSQGQQIPAQQPVLASPRPYTPPVSPAQLSKYTANARNSYNMPPIPNNQIDMMSEGLIRMGGAGLGTAEDGPLAQWSAMTGAYGDIKDYNRAREMEQYQAEEARMLEEQRRQDLLRKMNATQAKAKKGDSESAAKTLVALQNAQDVLDGFDRRDNVVGWGSFFVRGWDKLTGDERENLRLKIETMKVDRVLANIAQTKGAISEKEMDIFMSDQPSWLDGEEIWRKWITDYMAAIRVMHTNLANGTTVENGASMNTLTTQSSPSETPAPNVINDPEINAILEQYPDPNVASQ